MECILCGGSQAAHLTVRKVVSLILWFNTTTYNANLCALCAEHVYLDAQSTTLKAGWWGPLSAVFTLYNGPSNYYAIKNHREKLPYISHEGFNLPRPQLSAVRDNGVRFALLLVSLVVFVFLYSIGSSPSNPTPPSSYLADSIVGSCWADAPNDQLERVDCGDSNATYVVSFTTSDSSDCSGYYLKGDALDDWTFACLSSN